MTKLEIISELNKLPKAKVVDLLSMMLFLTSSWINEDKPTDENSAYNCGWYDSRFCLLDTCLSPDFEDLYDKILNK